MKIFPLVLGVFLASNFWSTAQVTVEVVLDQEQFLLNESLPVKVRVTNRSGQALQLGQEKDWLTFTIASRDGYLISELSEVPVVGEQALESSMAASRLVDLMPYFDLSKAGSYTVVATVKIKQWNEELVSKPKNFEIARGTKIWEREFGVPSAEGVAPEGRKYALQQANYGKRMLLYVRVTDLNENKVFKVFPAGQLLSFSKPEARIDRVSDLQLLFQNGARSFLYLIVSPEGEILLRQNYDYTATRPVLRSDEDGKTFVAGGVRRLAANDVPVPSPTTSTNDARIPVPKP